MLHTLESAHRHTVLLHACVRPHVLVFYISAGALIAAAGSARTGISTRRRTHTHTRAHARTLAHAPVSTELTAGRKRPPLLSDRVLSVRQLMIEWLPTNHRGKVMGAC